MVDDLTSDGPYATRLRAAPDFDRPGSARVYDFLLGGASHGEVDRAMARDLLAAEPRVVAMVRENRAFVRRAVDFLVDSGIDQFLDLGSGIPTMGSVHEVARRRSPDTQVVHVDDDPVAAAFAEHLLADVEGVATIRADLRDAEVVLGAPAIRRLIDLSRPVGLLLFSVLQHVPDEDGPGAIITSYLDRLAPGSALAVSHLSDDDPRLDLAPLTDATRSYGGGGIQPRSGVEVAELMQGVELVEPGLVWAAQWRPEPGRRVEPPVCGHRAGVGFLPGA